MRTIKLTIAYDGTDFHGWQIQPGQPTVQGLLIEVLERVTQENLSLQGAGRTDAGVHAAGQVASFQTESDLAPAVFLRACNALLPAAIRVRSAEEVSPDFHARRSALGKTYRYHIYRGQVLPPSLWRYALHEPHPLDFAAMADAASRFEGEHDFTSFAASTGDDEEDRGRTTVRNVYRSEMSADTANDEWLYTIRGKSFLRNMVRKDRGERCWKWAVGVSPRRTWPPCLSGATAPALARPLLRKVCL